MCRRNVCGGDEGAWQTEYSYKNRGPTNNKSCRTYRQGQSMRFHWFSSIALVPLLLTSSPQAGASDLHIRYAEPISFQSNSASRPSIRDLTATGRLSFQAYGRQFDLNLESNARLLGVAATQQQGYAASYQLLRGKVQGLQGSWVRITRIGEELHGAIWDGHDLYTIAPARIVNRFAVDRLAVGGSAPVVYRLSDTDSDTNPLSCGVNAPDENTVALSAYQSLLGELEADTQIAQSSAGAQLDVAVIGDYEFYSTHPQNTEAELLARMNVVDGIFSDQVGVSIRVSQVKIFTTPAEPFTTSTGADLLEQLGRYRAETPVLRTPGLVHLVTGRDIVGSMAGIAYVGTVCDASHGVGISEGQYDLTMGALIAAHEIGHNFGASHDAEAGSPCQSTPATFLMAAQINGSNTFSQCSLERMRPSVLGASCITRTRLVDASLESTPTTIEGTAGAAVSLSVEVDAVGSAPLQDVLVSISLQAPVAVESAIVPGGSCATGAGGATCELSIIEAGGSRRINVMLRSSSPGTFSSTVSVSTPNDVNATNDQRVISLIVNPAAAAPTAAAGSGGGGATEIALMLTLFGVLRRRFRRQRSCGDGL